MVSKSPNSAMDAHSRWSSSRSISSLTGVWLEMILLTGSSASYALLMSIGVRELFGKGTIDSRYGRALDEKVTARLSRAIVRNRIVVDDVPPGELGL